MSDARVRSDEHKHVRLLEIRIGVRRRVEPERFLVGCHGRRHALAGIAIAMDETHPELGKRSQETQLLVCYLARTEPRHGIRTELLLNRLESQHKSLKRGVPIHGFHFSRLIPKKRSCGAILRGKRRKSLPAFRAGHAQIHGIVGIGREINRLAVSQMDVQPTAGRTKSAHRRGGIVRREPARHFPEPELSGMQHELAG